MISRIRRAFAAWRLSRRPRGYVPSTRELARARSQHLAAAARWRAENGIEPAGYRALHTGEYPVVGAVSAADLVRRLRAERRRSAARRLLVELRPRHGRRRAPRPVMRRITRSARRTEPVRSTARPSGALHRATVAVGDILAGRAERVIRRHYAPGSWGMEDHTGEIWAVA